MIDGVSTLSGSDRVLNPRNDLGSPKGHDEKSEQPQAAQNPFSVVGHAKSQKLTPNAAMIARTTAMIASPAIRPEASGMR